MSACVVIEIEFNGLVKKKLKFFRKTTKAETLWLSIENALLLSFTGERRRLRGNANFSLLRLGGEGGSEGGSELITVNGAIEKLQHGGVYAVIFDDGEADDLAMRKGNASIESSIGDLTTPLLTFADGDGDGDGDGDDTEEEDDRYESNDFTVKSETEDSFSDGRGLGASSPIASKLEARLKRNYFVNLSFTNIRKSRLESRRIKDEKEKALLMFKNSDPVLSSYFSSEQKMGLLLQFKILTHLASERTFLVWQRCSITLLGAALTALKIGMEHERVPIKPIYDDAYSSVDDSIPVDDSLRVDDSLPADDYSPAEDDNDDYNVTTEYYFSFAVGMVLLIIVLVLNLFGMLHFRRTKEWLKSDSILLVEFFDSSEMNALFLCFVLIVASAFAIFADQIIFLSRGDDTASADDDDVYTST